MNFKENESKQKLSGIYYTPKWIADFIARWISRYDARSILEPSCGDGVFFQSLSENTSSEIDVLGFDTDSSAIRHSRERELSSSLNLTTRCEDFLTWAIENIKAINPVSFDSVVGNPPFIRYQYLDKGIQQAAQDLFSLMGQKFTKHTNAWLPFLLASVAFLRPGGHIGMIIPAEILHVLYAQGIRDYLLASCSKVLLIDPEDIWFEDTLQGAMLLMAEKRPDGNSPSNLGIVRTVERSFTENNPRSFFEQADYLPASFLTGKWTYALFVTDTAFCRKIDGVCCREPPKTVVGSVWLVAQARPNN